MKFALTALLMSLTLNAWAGIGVVLDNKGTACEIQRGKTKLPGQKGASVESMDTYITGSCVSNIRFQDDTKVRITENSKLLIDDFVFDPKKSDAGKLAIKAAMGTVRYTSGQIAKNNPQRVNIKTPTASIAVRGTDFTMTVDEAGQSLIVLIPSCKDESEVKQFELDEQRCRVGKIEVTTNAGTVELDKAFEATFVMSNSILPTPPVIMNTIESKINNNLILVRPPEVQRAIAAAGKSKREQELEELEAEAQRQMAQRIEKAREESKPAEVLPFTYATGAKGCNPATNICVNWENPAGPDIQSRGRGIAFRKNEDHYAEVKTLGYASNTSITITHDDQSDTTVIGSGDPNGNIVSIKQNTGVLKRPQ
jgi:hypothetical protein